MADAVLEILRVIQGDIAGLKADMTTVKTELRVHSRTLDVVLQEGRLLRAAVNDTQRKMSPRARSRRSTTTLIACSAICPRLRSAST